MKPLPTRLVKNQPWDSENVMGFWSVVGKAAKAGIDHASKVNQEAKSNIDKYEQRDDSYIKDKLNSGTIAAKMAAARVLKNRGYTKDSL